MVWCDQDRAGSIKASAAPPAVGSHTPGDHAPDRTEDHAAPVPSSGGSRLEGADVAVAQAVVDQGEQAAGDRDGGDVAAAAGGDLRRGAGQPAGWRRDALRGLDRGPADQRGALFICGNPGRPLAGCPVISGSSRRWLTAPGWCRGPGSGVSPTAQRPEGLDGGAGLAHHHRASEKITSADQVWCMRVLLAGLGLAAGFPGCVGRPCLSGCSARSPGPATRWRSGCLDGRGRSFLVGCPARGPAATGLPGADRGFIG